MSDVLTTWLNYPVLAIDELVQWMATVDLTEGVCVGGVVDDLAWQLIVLHPPSTYPSTFQMT